MFGHKSIFDLHSTQAQSQMWRCWIHNSLRERTIHLGPTLSGRSRIRNSLPHFLRRRNDVQVNSVWCMMNQQELFFGSLTDPPYLPQTLIPKLHLALWFSLPQSRLHLALHQSSLPLVLQFNLSHSRLNLAPWFRLIQFSPTRSRLPVLHAGQYNLSQVQELIAGIARFWETVNIAKCKKYIGHLRKVVPKIIECNGQATGY